MSVDVLTLDALVASPLFSSLHQSPMLDREGRMTMRWTITVFHPRFPTFDLPLTASAPTLDGALVAISERIHGALTGRLPFAGDPEAEILH